MMYNSVIKFSIFCAACFLLNVAGFAQDSLAVKDTVVSSRSLKEVTITDRTPRIEHKIDRVVFNADKSIVAQNGTLWEMLRLVPNVRTQSGGGVSVGEKSATVYIDDVPVQLAGQDLANFLMGYSGAGINKIEVFNVPPAKYEANGGAVINIITKKRLTNGLYGDIGLSHQQSTYSRQRASLNLNGKFHKIDFSLNANQTIGKYLTTDQEYIVYNTAGVVSNWDINNRLVEKRPSSNILAGLRYTVSKTSSLSVQLTKSYIKNDGASNIHSQVQSLSKIDSLIDTRNSSSFHSNYTNLIANYKSAIDTSGGSISISGNQLWYSNDPEQYLQSATFHGNGDPLSTYANISTSLQDTRISAVQADLSKKYGAYYLDAGMKVYFVKTNSDRSLSEAAGKMNNLFIYKENNEAAYLSVYRAWKKFAAKLGLRGEFTQLDISSKGIAYDSVNTSDYFKLFPTLYLDYSLNGSNRLVFSANRRIARPEYYRLNPFVNFTTPYYTTSGNPYLRPSIVSTLNMDYILQNNYTFSLFYTRTQDRFTDVTVQDNETKKFRDIQKNIGTSTSIGSSFYCDLSPASFWQMSHFLRLAYKTEKSTDPDQPFTFHKFVYYYSFDNSVTIDTAKTWTAELHFYFASSTIQGIFNNDKMYNLSLGLRKRIKKFSVSLTVNDIFFSDYSRIRVHYRDQNNGFTFKNDSRSLTLGLRYTFNMKAARDKGFEKLESGSEVDRVDNSK